MKESIKPILDGIFETGSSPSLLGGYCPACERKFFPAPAVCPQCLMPVESVQLSREGKIYSFTIIRIKPPFGLPQPYAVGYVDLEGDNLRIIGLLDPEKIDRLSVGKPVTVSVAPMGVDRCGEPCLRYFFTTKEGGSET
jgi:uncharacterized OB-fold protein